jgi:predicted dienelactone hydrolase
MKPSLDCKGWCVLVGDTVTFRLFTGLSHHAVRVLLVPVSEDTVAQPAPAKDGVMGP